MSKTGEDIGVIDSTGKIVTLSDTNEEKETQPSPLTAIVTFSQDAIAPVKEAATVAITAIDNSFIAKAAVIGGLVIAGIFGLMILRK